MQLKIGRMYAAKTNNYIYKRLYYFQHISGPDETFFDGQ